MKANADLSSHPVDKATFAAQIATKNYKFHESQGRFLKAMPN